MCSQDLLLRSIFSYANNEKIRRFYESRRAYENLLEVFAEILKVLLLKDVLIFLQNFVECMQVFLFPS